jgi:hypothetical protein
MIAESAASPTVQAPKSLFPQEQGDDLSSYAYRQLIGYIGLVFPFAVILVARWRRMPVLERFKVLPSVSAYYYTGSVAIFVGLLVALGLFLLTYKGYGNEYGRRDRITSRIAGLAAIFVALFPTEAPDKSLELFWWTKATGRLHFGAATVLFLSLSFFSLFLFTKTKPTAREKLPTAKRVRNSIYMVCGVVMVTCIAWAGIATFMNAPIFLPEAIALEAFAVSWLTKGRVEGTVVGVASRVWYYGRNPKRAVARLNDAVRGEGERRI